MPGIDDEDYLSCTIRSLSPAGIRRLAPPVAQRWGRDEVLAPDRAGFSERTKLLRSGSLVDRLEEAWADARELDDLWLYVERPELELIGDLRCFEQLDEHGGSQDHSVQFSLALHHAQDLPAIVDLAADLFVAIDGYFGSIDTVSMGSHQFVLASDGGRRGEVPRLEAGDMTTFRFEHLVDGPWWVNLYGPAFVARWGDAVVDQLGTARRRLANGGVLVMTAPDPVPVDPSVTSLLGHPHQQLLAQQVGADTFLHETGSNVLPPAGQFVPSRADHVAAAVRYRRAAP